MCLEVIYVALPPGKKSIAVTVTKENYDKLKKIADRDRRSISFIANEYIEQGLKRDGE